MTAPWNRGVLRTELPPMEKVVLQTRPDVAFNVPIPTEIAALADTMATGWQPKATPDEIDAAERAATRWRQLRRRETTLPPVETTTPPYETRAG